jgi:hypothetical protein
MFGKHDWTLILKDSIMFGKHGGTLILKDSIMFGKHDGTLILKDSIMFGIHNGTLKDSKRSNDNNRFQEASKMEKATVLESESVTSGVCDNEWKLVKSKNGKQKRAKVVVEDKDRSNNVFIIGLHCFGQGG